MSDPVIVTSKSRLDSVVMAAAKAAVEEVLAATRGSREDRIDFAWVPNERAMELLSLSRPTLARYRKDGKLPYSLVGGRVYYRLEDVEALLESGRKGQ